MKNIIGMISALVMLISLPIIVIGMYLVEKLPLITILLIILKLTGAVEMMWFGGLIELSALGTPLWTLLFLSVIMFVFWGSAALIDEIRKVK